MTRERMTELVSETICATREEARRALEATGWDVLAAARLLQRQARQAVAAQKDGAVVSGGFLRRLAGRFAGVRPAFTGTR